MSSSSSSSSSSANVPPDASGGAESTNTSQGTTPGEPAGGASERERETSQPGTQQTSQGLPFALETPLERRIAADPTWRAGVAWGRPRPGHHEGSIANHIADVLANVDREASTPEEREALRLVTLVHDALKYQVDMSRPKVGPNHHAMLARYFAARYISDAALLDLIELHDEAYHAWRRGAVYGNWEAAQERAQELLERIGDAWPLYLRFYRADNNTPSKHREPVRWFEAFLRAQGLDVPPPGSEDCATNTGDQAGA